jgi:hypothetical protein
MRLVYLTSDPADAGLLHAELARGGVESQVEGCAAARDVLAHVRGMACDALVIDTSVARALYLIDDLRRHLPQHPIVALTRAHGDEDAGMALVAGADECVARTGPWLSHLAAAVRRRVFGDGRRATGADVTSGPEAPPPPPRAPLSELAAQLEQERAARLAAEERYRALVEAHEAERLRWAEEARETDRRWQEVAAQQGAHSQLADALRAAEDRLIALLDERRRETQHVAALKEQLSRQRGLADSAAAECARLQSDLASARQGAARLELEQSSTAHALETERTRADTAAADRDVLQERARALQDEVARLERELEASLDRLGAAARERTGLAAELEESGARLVEAIGRLNATERDRAADRAAREAAAHELDQLRDALSRTAEARAAEQARAEAVTAALDQTRRAAAADLADLDEARARNAVARDEIDRLTGELARAGAAADEAAAHVARLEGDLGEERRRGAAARDEADRLALDLASTRAALDEARSQVARLEGDLEAARAPSLELARELAESRAARNEALAELARVRATLEDYIIARAALEHRASEASARATVAEADLEASKGTIDALRAEREALDAREAGLQVEISQVLAELASVRAVAEQRRRSAQDVEGRLGAALAQVAALQQAAADLERERAAAIDARHDAETRAQATALEAESRGALLHDEIAGLRQQLERVTATWLEERTSAERLLRAQEDRERWLSQASGVGVATATEHGTILRANDRCATLLGAESATELLARVPAPALPHALVLAAFQKGTAGVSPPAVPPEPVEVCVEHADGRLAWVEATVRRVTPATAEPPTCEWVLAEVTDRQLRARQAGQARRLDGARALAGAAGEDLARSAQEAGRAAARLLDLLDAGSAARHEAEGLLASVRRLEAVLRQIVAFVQQRTRVGQVVDLDTWLPACAATLRRVAGETITVEAQRAGRPLRAEVDPPELDQALSTLGLAAREALPFGGAITLRLDTVAVPAAAPDRPVRQMAHLAVSLSGFGLRHGPSVAALLDQVQCAGVSIEARHEPAVGTTVSLLIPLVFSAGPQPLAPSSPATGAGTPGPRPTA